MPRCRPRRQADHSALVNHTPPPNIPFYNVLSGKHPASSFADHCCPFFFSFIFHVCSRIGIRSHWPIRRTLASHSLLAMDDTRFRLQQSPRNETPLASYVSTPRRDGRFSQQAPQDPRATMPRRFTTDSTRVPTLSSMTPSHSSSSRGIGIDPIPDFNNVGVLYQTLGWFLAASWSLAP